MQQATRIARAMVTQYGMSEKVYFLRVLINIKWVFRLDGIVI